MYKKIQEHNKCISYDDCFRVLTESVERGDMTIDEACELNKELMSDFITESYIQSESELNKLKTQLNNQLKVMSINDPKRRFIENRIRLIDMNISKLKNNNTQPTQVINRNNFNNLTNHRQSVITNNTMVSQHKPINNRAIQ